ncbi:uncharacterized protein N7483_008070 [Penicillium malachiteum]|uniref:uncharacterized protein n=1 Tax=Penicillium malachiteum TaxID=1324776 RepID=UPI002548287C|nr:uncharacterized protein N7483_008070 [Penicillium malachiteum]KAJ5726713.1 hypothetical protein N7483_008070 [Penicillium malachiteum]
MDPDDSIAASTFWSALQVVLALLIGYTVAWCAYSLWLHPLSRYPGPKLAACFPIPHLLWDIRGKQHSTIKELHDKYGDVVRISPNALAYRAAAAWRDIYGHRKKGQKVFIKDPSLYTTLPNGVNAIITANEKEHQRMRRLLTHAFSNKALGEQEGILHTYADMLIDKLGEVLCESCSPVVDLTRWFNFTTFDLIGDLAFGEPFDCLANTTYHWWVLIILDAVKASTYLKIFWFFPFLLPLLAILVPNHLLEKRTASFNLSVEKMRRRINSKTTRPDFTSYILKHSNDGRGLSQPELDANAAVFVLAGSETTAALLSGCIYYLLRHEDKYNRLIEEIRSAFNNPSEINLTAIAELSYLIAVLTETLRIYPPIPAMLPRIVPEGGAMIDDKYVPGGVSVSVSLFSAFRAATHFKDPDSFIPERWLEGPESADYVLDNRDAFHPFSYGPRNCLGQHLANAEMRLILTKLLYHYDFSLEAESEDWVKQYSFSLWSRPELMVKLTRAGDSDMDGDSRG